MNELIKVAERQIGDGAIQTVNARDLHAFLGVGKDFSTWVNDRIQQYGFVENQDFVCSPILGSKERSGRGGSNRKDYHLTLDMAKELAMVERNNKGKQARLYFIESGQFYNTSQYLNCETVQTKVLPATGAAEVVGDTKTCKVSIIGIGMRSHAGVASKMFETLAENNINIQMISTSEIKISVLIQEEQLETAVKALHTAFGLDREDGESKVAGL